MLGACKLARSCVDLIRLCLRGCALCQLPACRDAAYTRDWQPLFEHGPVLCLCEMPSFETCRLVIVHSFFVVCFCSNPDHSVKNHRKTGIPGMYKMLQNWYHPAPGRFHANLVPADSSYFRPFGDHPRCIIFDWNHFFEQPILRRSGTGRPT